METTSTRQILKVINPVIGFHWVTVSEKTNLTFAIITTTSDIYVYSPSTQEFVNQWSISQDLSKRLTIPAVLNRITRFFYTVQANRTVYIWSDKMDTVSSWKKVQMTDDVVGLMTNDLLGENVLLLTKRGHLSLLNQKDNEKELWTLKNMEVMSFASANVKKSVYLAVLGKRGDQYIIQTLVLSKNQQNEFISVPSFTYQIPASTEIPVSMEILPSLNRLVLLFSNGEMKVYSLYMNQEGQQEILLDEQLFQFERVLEGFKETGYEAKKKKKTDTALSPEFTRIQDSYILLSTPSLQLWDIQYGILRSVQSLSAPVTACAYSSFQHALLLATQQEESATVSYAIQLCAVTVQSSTLAGAVQSTIQNPIQTNFPHILTLSKNIHNINVGYNDSQKWEEEIKREIDMEEPEYRDIYMTVMEEKPMTDEEFETNILHYFQYQCKLHKDLSKVFFSQKFVMNCLKRCCLKDHCLYEPLFTLFRTSQVSINSYNDLIPYLCSHCDLVMIEQAIRYIRDLSEKDIVYIIRYLLFSAKDEDFAEFLKKKELYKENYTAIDCQKITYYYLFPYLINKRFSTPLLSSYFSKFDINIIIFILQLSSQLLFDYDRSKPRVSCLDAVPLTQFYVWIGTLLDSHLYDIIFYAKKDPQLMQLLHDLDNYINEYKALSDTCYNVRAILTHIEEKVSLPVSAIPIYTIEEIPF